MGRNKIKIGILSSSRADYGIYLPLIKELSNSDNFDVELIAFGTHLSKYHGYTFQNIDRSNFTHIHKLEHLLVNDSPNAIATSFGLISLKFADFWQNNSFDLVFALGDRFEMAAAVITGVVYGVKFAHIHGGETTLGAIDNVYRHSITMSSFYHFTTTENHKNKVISLVESSENIYNVGSLSLDNLENIDLLSKEEFKSKWNIDLNLQTILVTVHPETVDFEKNKFYADQIYKSIEKLSESSQIVVTMPNADTSGILFRDVFNDLQKKYADKIILIENFGTQSYFTCMNYASLVLGNSSSGIIEAASFNKYVINIGDRQKGRECGDNVKHIPFDSNEIIDLALTYLGKIYNKSNIYFNGGASKKIVKYLIQNYVEL